MKFCLCFPLTSHIPYPTLRLSDSEATAPCLSPKTSAPLSVRIRTFSKWRVPAVWDKGDLDVSLDTGGDASPEYEAVIRSDGTRVRGLLFRGDAKYPFRSLEVRRPSARSVLVVIPFGRLSFGRGRWFFRWSVESVWNEGPCAGACIDRVPDAGSPPEPRS